MIKLPPITKGTWRLHNSDPKGSTYHSGDIYSGEDSDSLIFAVRFMGGDNKEGAANGKLAASAPLMLKALVKAYERACDDAENQKMLVAHTLPECVESEKTGLKYLEGVRDEYRGALEAAGCNFTE